MRDSTFTLQALHYLDLDWEAEEFVQFVAGLETIDDGGLQIMYGIDGRRDLTETTRDDLSGYRGARPVRIGNGAWDQRQNDVYGAVLDSILLHTRRSERLPRGLWPLVQTQAQCATAVWRDPGGPHLVVPPPLDREHAGLTTFLTSASREQAARSGLIEDDRIVGVALSTDGLLDALLRLDTNSRVGPHWVAPLDFEHYFKRSASGAFDGDALDGVLASRRFASTSDDDKTLLLAVRT